MSPNANQDSDIPRSLERSEVPLYFRQFRDAAVLKKLAHRGTGPLYQLIGRKAWYETADIIAWLESRKCAGPWRPRPRPKADTADPTKASDEPARKRRGRPTKAEQRRRAVTQQNALHAG